MYFTCNMPSDLASKVEQLDLCKCNSGLCVQYFCDPRLRCPLGAEQPLYCQRCCHEQGHNHCTPIIVKLVLQAKINQRDLIQKHAGAIHKSTSVLSQLMQARDVLISSDERNPLDDCIKDEEKLKDQHDKLKKLMVIIEKDANNYDILAIRENMLRTVVEDPQDILNRILLHSMPLTQLRSPAKTIQEIASSVYEIPGNINPESRIFLQTSAVLLSKKQYHQESQKTANMWKQVEEAKVRFKSLDSLLQMLKGKNARKKEGFKIEGFSQSEIVGHDFDESIDCHFGRSSLPSTSRDQSITDLDNESIQKPYFRRERAEEQQDEHIDTDHMEHYMEDKYQQQYSVLAPGSTVDFDKAPDENKDCRRPLEQQFTQELQEDDDEQEMEDDRFEKQMERSKQGMKRQSTHIERINSEGETEEVVRVHSSDFDEGEKVENLENTSQFQYSEELSKSNIGQHPTISSQEDSSQYEESKFDPSLEVPRFMNGQFTTESGYLASQSVTANSAEKNRRSMSPRKPNNKSQTGKSKVRTKRIESKSSDEKIE